MNEIKTFISKLSAMNLTEVDGNELKGDAFAVVFKTEMSNVMQSSTPLKLTVSVFYKDKRVSFWGCVDSEDTKLLVSFFYKTKRDILDDDFESGEILIHEGQQKFNAL